MKTKTTKLSRGALVAALYVAMCFIFKPISYSALQFRLAEILVVLPIFIPEAIYGLFIGCFLSNLLGGASIALFDTVLGSLTTLLSAYLTYKIFKKTDKMFLSLIPPVILNALIVGTYVPFIYPVSDSASLAILVLSSIASVFIGEAVVVYFIGLPFAKALKKTRIFKC